MLFKLSKKWSKLKSTAKSYYTLKKKHAKGTGGGPKMKENVELQMIADLYTAHGCTAFTGLEGAVETNATNPRKRRAEPTDEEEFELMTSDESSDSEESGSEDEVNTAGTITSIQLI